MDCFCQNRALSGRGNSGKKNGRELTVQNEVIVRLNVILNQMVEPYSAKQDQMLIINAFESIQTPHIYLQADVFLEAKQYEFRKNHRKEFYQHFN